MRRLTAELARAQAQAHGAGAAAEQRTGGDPSFLDAAGPAAPLPLWIAEPAYLSPLLVAYDARVAELEAAAQRRGGDAKDVQTEVAAVTAENARLHDELKHVTALLAKRERALASAAAAGGAPVLGPGEGGADSRVALLTEENDLLLQQQSALKEELKGLHATLEERTAEAVRASQELAAAAAARRRDTTELAAAQSKLASLELAHGSGAPSIQEELAALRARAKEAQRDADTARARESELRDRHDGIVAEIASLRSAASTHAAEHARLTAELQAAVTARDAGKREVDDMRDALQATEARLAELQRRDADVYARIKEAMEHAEEARLARERSLLSEQKKDVELARLSEKLVTQRHELEARAAAEVEHVRSELQAAQDAHHLAQSSLSEENESLRMAADRARREASEARSEAEHMRMLLRQGAAAASKTADAGGAAASPEEAAARAAAASEELEVMREERDTSARELSLARMQLERERKQFAAVAEGLTTRLSESDAATARADDRHAASVRELNGVRAELTSARLALERAAEASKREVARLQTEHEVALKASLEKVEAARAAQRASTAEANVAAEERARALASSTRAAEEADRRLAEAAAAARAAADASRQRLSQLESERAALAGEVASLREEVHTMQKADAAHRPSFEAAKRQAELYARKLAASAAEEEARLRECAMLRDRVEVLEGEKRRAERQRDALAERIASLQKEVAAMQNAATSAGLNLVAAVK